MIDTGRGPVTLGTSGLFLLWCVMRWFAHLIFCRLVGRRCVCALLLVAYAITAAGVPIPVASLPKKRGEIFPCMASSCGCRTADQCWRSCCCHTLSQRLAWARKRGIEPPGFVIAQARAAGFDFESLAAASCDDAGQCCRSNSQATVAADKASSCCRDRDAQHSSSEPQNDRIVAWRALACRGLPMNWLAAVPNMVIARPEVSHEIPLIGWLGPAISEFAVGESDHPTVPPPEMA
jgi:hypothetical protein